MLGERGVMNSWRILFHGKEITTESLAEAEALLDGVSGESPLHIRLAKELKEIPKLQVGKAAATPEAALRPKLVHQVL